VRLCIFRHTGISECIVEGETGFLVDEGDSVGFADALKQLWSSPQTAIQMGQSGQTPAKENFDLNKQSLKLETRFLDLISRK
jgi:glycosyltransferase involved in cell wall biosynthesis